MLDTVRTLALLLLAVSMLAPARCQEGVEQTPDVYCQCQFQGVRSNITDIACHADEDDVQQCNRSNTPNVPAGYQWLQGYGLYKLYLTGRQFEDAGLQCARDGGRLAIPSDATAAAGLAAMLAELPQRFNALVGIVGSETGDTWLGVDGEAAPYLPWVDGEPQIDVGQCVVLDTFGLISTANCSLQQSFFCERLLNESITLENYTWFDQAGRFYRLHEELLPYEQARTVCVNEGGDYGVPDTMARAEAVLGLVPGNIGSFFVGLNNFTVMGEWAAYATGRLLSDMEFQNWSTEPSTGQNCLALYSGGYYHDMNCRADQPYLCEVIPP